MKTIRLADGREARVRSTVDTPVGRVKVDGPVRLVIDFESAEKAVDFADFLRKMDMEGYDNADVFVMDGLDERPRSVEFIFRRATDRIPGTSLREALGFEPVVKYRMAKPE